MYQTLKNRFKNKYGEDNYRIIENYDLWHVKHNHLHGFEIVIFNYSHNLFLKKSGRAFNEKMCIFSQPEERVIDKLKLKDLDIESLFKLRKAVFFF